MAAVVVTGDVKFGWFAAHPCPQEGNPLLEVGQALPTMQQPAERGHARSGPDPE